MSEHNSTRKATAGNDLPVTSPEEDRYGYMALAESLSGSIIALDDNISTVIGIEGPWGSGKTSLLNLLLYRMKLDSPEGTYVLAISPWLSPGRESSVENLLIPVANKLNEIEEKNYSKPRQLWHKLRGSKASALATDVVRYAQQASGRLAPLAELAGNFIPGAGIVASTMKTISTADLSANGKTTAELRANIENRIAKLGLNFIVVLDDLDRLEPAQAVEVLRLVRSVADFSHFRYVMCYDPMVLGHAVERGLKVANGQHFLQKIVQLSFSLPRPESFDLRREFFTGTVELYMKVTGMTPDMTVLSDLKSVAGEFGATLSTPREVRLALGSLAFRYESLREYVWFPDLCLLQLLRVTCPGLYMWAEHYLTEVAVHKSGEGHVSQKEKEALGKELDQLLQDLPSESPLSVATLSRWLPGIGLVKSNPPKLFLDSREDTEISLNQDKRLQSSDYWRYYFAFAPPKNVHPPAFFTRLFQLAADTEKQAELAALLLEQVADNGFSSRTGFEQITDRLSNKLISGITQGSCRGLLSFLFSYGDELANRFRVRGELFATYDVGMFGLADRLLRRLCDTDRQAGLDFLRDLLTTGSAYYWSAVYLRHLLWQNGIKGNRPVTEAERILSDQEVNTLCGTFSRRMDNREIRKKLILLGDLAGLVLAWKEIDSVEAIARWMEEETHGDEAFLHMLLRLRYHGVSSASGAYQVLRLNDVAEFFGGVDKIKQRLHSIADDGHFPDLIKQVEESVTRGS
ncbi:KAP family P-loop NTPase fold protein [Erwinia billingiae]|uniref:KAP family P-loop NTPase fold protein n=1 Tax=Erwinia billingiae TaxID=182337 RepID=UPI00320B4029